MKKFFIISLSVIFVILAVLISVPFIFKNQIMQKVKQEVNKTVLAKVDWDGFSVSIIKGFPDLKVGMKNLSVVGINKFEGDTLVAFDEFALKVDLLSIFSGNIKVKSIFMDKPVVNAITLPDSSVNWDIMIPSDAEAPVPEATDTSSSGMVISLKSFIIKDGRINYIDKLYNMSASLNGLNFNLSGDLTEDFTKLDILSTVDAFTFTMDGLSYIKNARLDIKTIIDADLVKYNFVFSENEIKLNDLKMGIEGSFGMPNDTDMTMDLRFFSKETEFKSILSLVPAIYMQDYTGLKTKGKFSVNGTVKGVYNDKEMPKIDMTMKVSDGYFAYPDLPKSVDNINVDAKVFYDGVNEDNTRVDLNKFHMEMAGNPFDMQLHISTPMSDMQMNGAIKGQIDLASMADVVPAEGIEMEGIINMDVDFMGKMSDIDNENYEAFKAKGLFEVIGIEMKGKDLPAPVSVSKVTMNFSPKFVDLVTFDIKVGSSDIHMDGTLENFIPYVFKDEVIKGKLNLNSNFLNISELMPETDTTALAESEDTSSMSVVEIPRNIDFVLQTGIKKILYDKLELTDVRGKLIAKDGKAVMENLSMNLLEGSMVMSGEYNTQDITKPMVDFKLDIKEIDIPSSFIAFNTVQKIAPIAESMKGRISVKMDFISLLDSAMSPVMNSIAGSGTLETGDIEVASSETFEKIAAALKNDKLKDVKLKDVKANFEIKDGRVILKPFDTKIASYKVTIGGDQGMDMSMNYLMGFSIPRKEFGAAANDVYEGLIKQAASKGFDLKQSENVDVNVRITGTLTDPKVGLDVKENMVKAKADIKDAARDKVNKEVENVKSDVKEKANVEIDKIMKEAEEQAANIKRTAKEAGEKLVGEARLQGKNLIKEAGSNPIKKTVAEKTAALMVKKAQQNAVDINKEAETRANALLLDAQKRADALKK